MELWIWETVHAIPGKEPLGQARVESRFKGPSGRACASVMPVQLRG